MTWTRFRRAILAVLLVAWSLALTPPNQADAANGCPCNMFGSSTPTVSDSGPAAAHNLGFNFTSDIDGYVTGIRFYKSAANTGTHVGSLWAYYPGPIDYVLMGSVTFTNETASGWQIATFAQPLWIGANGTYVVSYSAPNGHFAHDSNYFSPLPSNGFLHAAQSGGSWTNDSDPLAFPGHATTGNYWVDVTFEPFIAAESLFGMKHPTPANPNVGDPGPVEVGTRFTSDLNTEVIGIRYWFANPYYSTPEVHLWNSAGTLLKSAQYADHELRTSWFEVYFDTPVSISAGAQYVVSLYQVGGSYGADTNMFAGGYDNGPFHVPANGGAYKYSGSSAFPDQQSAHNYWIDPIFAPTANVTTSVVVDPTFSLTVSNKATACNGESDFLAGAGSGTAVSLGRLAGSSNASGGQTLTVAGNASNGFAVYLRGTQASQNLRSGGYNWTDVSGTYGSPAALGAGERFGYTYADGTTASSVTNPSSANFIALDNVNRAVMGSASSMSGTGCVSYDAQTGGATPAGSYSATVIYTGVPAF